MGGTLMPYEIATASVSQGSFLLTAVFAMDRSKACTNLELHALRFWFGATPGARDHPGFVSDFFFGAIAFLRIGPVACFLGELPLPSDGGSYRDPSNADDDLASLILFTAFPMFGKLLFGFWIVRHLLFHDCISDFFFFVPSHLAVSSYGRLMPVDSEVA